MNVTILAPGHKRRGASAMTIAPDNVRPGGSHRYRAMRDFIQSTDDTLPGKLEVTKEGIVHDMMAPVGPHELTTVHLRRRLEKVMPEELVAHTGEPDVEDASEGIMRRPDVMVIAMADMNVPGSFDPRTLIAAIEVVSRSNPDNDWVTKARDYPLMGIPVYVIFDPRTSTGAVLTDIHATPVGPRYATRKDFVYGEEVTIAEWTISTENLPRYKAEGEGEAEGDPAS
jgi:Uma2 family endonuclease